MPWSQWDSMLLEITAEVMRISVVKTLDDMTPTERKQLFIACRRSLERVWAAQLCRLAAGFPSDPTEQDHIAETIGLELNELRHQMFQAQEAAVSGSGVIERPLPSVDDVLRTGPRAKVMGELGALIKSGDIMLTTLRPRAARNCGRNETSGPSRGKLERWFKGQGVTEAGVCQILDAVAAHNPDLLDRELWLRRYRAADDPHTALDAAFEARAILAAAVAHRNAAELALLSGLKENQVRNVLQWSTTTEWQHVEAVVRHLTVTEAALGRLRRLWCLDPADNSSARAGGSKQTYVDASPAAAIAEQLSLLRIWLERLTEVPPGSFEQAPRPLWVPSLKAYDGATVGQFMHDLGDCLAAAGITQGSLAGKTEQSRGKKLSQPTVSRYLAGRASEEDVARLMDAVDKCSPEKRQRVPARNVVLRAFRYISDQRGAEEMEAVARRILSHGVNPDDLESLAGAAGLRPEQVAEALNFPLLADWESIGAVARTHGLDEDRLQRLQRLWALQPLPDDMD